MPFKIFKLKSPISFLLLLGLTLTNVHTAFAMDIDITRNSLKGIKEVQVVVDMELRREAEIADLNREQIQTDVELRLRMAGIKVLSNEEFTILYVIVNAIKSDTIPAYVFNINVSFVQPVCLVRDPILCYPATTWSRETLGVVGSNKLKDTRDTIKDLVDSFINAYLSVNPPEKPILEKPKSKE